MSRESKDVSDRLGELWAALSGLWGGVKAVKYRDYVLAFIFYRYLSEQQERYLVQENVLDIVKGESVNEAYGRTAVGAEAVEYIRDISASLGYAILPADTWPSLLQRIRSGQMQICDYQTFFEHFQANIPENPQARIFQGIFNLIDLGNPVLGSSLGARCDALNTLVDFVNGIDSQDLRGNDILAEIYDGLMDRFVAAAGKKGLGGYTPVSVRMLMAAILAASIPAAEPPCAIYDPLMGSASLLQSLGAQLATKQDVQYFGQEIDGNAYAIGRMNLLIHGIPYQNIFVSHADTLAADWPATISVDGEIGPQCFEAVAATLPSPSNKWEPSGDRLQDPRFQGYGKLAPASKAEYAFIQHGLYHLQEEGAMTIVLPHGVLFRGAAEGQIRQNLIERNYIDAVIGLPANLFYDTNVPTVLLVLKKKRAGTDILFIDASREFIRGKVQNWLSEVQVEKIIHAYRNRQPVDRYAYIASQDEIQANGCNLNISRYIDTFDEEPIDMGQTMADLERLREEIAVSEASLADSLAGLSDRTGVDILPHGEILTREDIQLICKVKHDDAEEIGRYFLEMIKEKR